MSNRHLSLSPVTGKPTSSARLRAELAAYQAQIADVRSRWVIKPIVKAYCVSFRQAAKDAGFYLP